MSAGRPQQTRFKFHKQLMEHKQLKKPQTTNQGHTNNKSRTHKQRSCLCFLSCASYHVLLITVLSYRLCLIKRCVHTRYPVPSSCAPHNTPLLRHQTLALSQRPFQENAQAQAQAGNAVGPGPDVSGAAASAFGSAVQVVGRRITAGDISVAVAVCDKAPRPCFDFGMVRRFRKNRRVAIHIRA